MSADVPTGVVLFAHGARDPRWADTIEALAQRLGERSPGLPIETAYLEFMTPDLRGAVAALAQRGAVRIVVAPVFLSAGGHVLHDLPRRLAELQPAFPGLTFSVLPALGAAPEVIDAMALACVQGLDATKRS